MTNKLIPSFKFSNIDITLFHLLEESKSLYKWPHTALKFEITIAREVSLDWKSTFNIKHHNRQREELLFAEQLMPICAWAWSLRFNGLYCKGCWWCLENQQWGTRQTRDPTTPAQHKKRGSNREHRCGASWIPFEGQDRTSHNSRVLERGKLCVPWLVSVLRLL